MRSANAVSADGITQRRRRVAFGLAIIAGLLLMLTGFFGAIMACTGNMRLFQAGVDRYVVGRGLLSQSDADSFVTETITYLNGGRDNWAPSVLCEGHVLAIPEAFTQHMGTVRHWISVARVALPLAAAIALGQAGWALMLCRRTGSWRVPLLGYTVGAAFPLLLALGVSLWGALNFDGFWAWVHNTFIRGGIFSAREEIMQLFPRALFADYLPPVGMAFGLWVLGMMALPLIVLGVRRLMHNEMRMNHTR